MKPRKSILLLVTVAALVLSAAAAGTASAAPIWKFNGAELVGNETAVGGALSSALTIPGITTECAHFLYNLKIKNEGGAGKGEVTELPLFECTTSSKNCTVESIEAKKLNWPAHLATFGTKDYIVIEKVEVEIHYAGGLCAFSETPVVVKGSAGGVIENSAQTATFSKATLEASGTSLKVGATSIEWKGVFTTEGFETHREQLIEG